MKKTNRIHVIHVATCLLAISLSGAPAWGQGLQADIRSTVDKTLSPQEETVLSISASRVLSHIAEARKALNTEDAEQAKSQLQQAHTLIDIIKEARPTEQVRYHIWLPEKDLDYDTTEECPLDLIPIEATIVENEPGFPVAQTPEALTGIKAKLQDQSEDTLWPDPSPQPDILLYTEVDLPLAATEEAVLEAQELIEQDELDAAVAALQRAEEGVQVLSLPFQSPVARAKKYLWQAMQDYGTGNDAVIETDLEQASSWLQRAAQSEQATIIAEADTLAQEIETLVGNAEGGRLVAITTISGLWKRTGALEERVLDQIPVGWQQYRVESPVRAELVDAQLHFGYGASYQWRTEEVQEARAEIAYAEANLRAAATQAEPVAQQKIERLEKESGQLKTQLSSHPDMARMHFGMITHELQQLIQDL